MCKNCWIFFSSGITYLVIDIFNLFIRHVFFRFITSFNRANLKYIITPKPKKTYFEGVLELINRSYKGQCGIVYCLSRNDCETVRVDDS